MLSGRVANIVPVDDIDKVTAAVNSYTQTTGIYPESLKYALRNTLPLFGAQRLTSRGYACGVAVAMQPGRARPDRRVDRRRAALRPDLNGAARPHSAGRRTRGGERNPRHRTGDSRLDEQRRRHVHPLQPDA